MDILQSKKFKVFALTVLANLVSLLAAQGILDPEWCKFLSMVVTAAGVAFIGAQGMADMGKEQEKEKKKN